mmetsp:Transcript_38673/g.56868  ORF Transcript_38673/g.56868 Transcript_38673/m.56868 type:complete len:198 (-) Transcript_38673:92-685(-)
MSSQSLPALMRNGSIYLALLHLLKKFCNGEFNLAKSLLGGYSEHRVRGVVITAEVVFVGLVAASFWVLCLSAGRRYHLEETKSVFIQVSRWDASNTSLVVTCLLSPLTLALLVMPWRAGTAPDSNWLLFLFLTWFCGSMTYMLMFLFDCRENGNEQARGASYSKATNDRAQWMMQSRIQERSRFESDQNLPATEWNR